MRFLTFNISGVNLGINVEGVASVRKGVPSVAGNSPVKNAKLLVLARELGLAQTARTEQAIISCRKDNETFDILVDKVQELESISDDCFHKWPENLGFLKIFNGVILIDKKPFLTINLDILAGQKYK